MFRTNFVTGVFVPGKAWLGWTLFNLILRRIVWTCVDCLVLNSNGEILLGKRIIYPWPDWWIIGGRMWPGESFETAAARNFKRELGFAVNPARFSQLLAYSFVWGERDQAPAGRGIHDVSIAMIILLAERETRAVRFDWREYSEVKWVPLKEAAADESLHPAVRQIASDLTRCWLFTECE